MVSRFSIASNTEQTENIGRQKGVGIHVSASACFAPTGPEQGLLAMLKELDDILLVLDERGRIINCKAQAGSRSTIFAFEPNELFIQNVLPALALKKYERALEQIRNSRRFILFESMLASSPNRASWYEFRLIPVLGNQWVLFIWNVNRYKAISRTIANLPISINKMIEGWSHALYLRDFETEDHTRRVAEMTVQLARRLGIPEEELLHIQRGAEVHDIGKIAIPDEILLKTGSLTPQEWQLMRLHPTIAVDLLEQVPQISPALFIPRSHHEKWDGSGYPDGLAGEDIPLAARIFAFADVYDALTSDRPYRKAWSRADALRYIRGEIGKHFDPAIAPEFIRLMLE